MLYRRVFNLKDLVVLIDHANKEFHDMPSRPRLEGMQRDLTPGEQRAVAFFSAALMVAGSMGLDTSEYVIKWDQPDSDPTED